MTLTLPRWSFFEEPEPLESLSEKESCGLKVTNFFMKPVMDCPRLNELAGVLLPILGVATDEVIAPLPLESKRLSTRLRFVELRELSNVSVGSKERES